jgi:hypothetical protein
MSMMSVNKPQATGCDSSGGEGVGNDGSWAPSGKGGAELGTEPEDGADGSDRASGDDEESRDGEEGEGKGDRDDDDKNDDEDGGRDADATDEADDDNVDLEMEMWTAEREETMSLDFAFDFICFIFHLIEADMYIDFFRVSFNSISSSVSSSSST